jgi:hypothetical protein
VRWLSKKQKEKKKEEKKGTLTVFQDFFVDSPVPVLSKWDVKCAPFSKASLSVKRFLQNSQVFDILRRISPISVQKYLVYE